MQLSLSNAARFHILLLMPCFHQQVVDKQNNLHVVLLAFLFLVQLDTLDLLIQASHGLASDDKIALTIEDHSTKVRFP